MQTPINQDFDQYRDDFFKGLSKRQTLWGALATILGILLIAFQFFYLHLPVEIAVFLALPFIAPVAINGFYQRNGMSFFQLMKLKIKVKNSKTLVLKCDDPRQAKIVEMEKEYVEHMQKKKGKHRNGKKEIETI